MSVEDLIPEITSNDDAQNLIQDVLGDLDDADTFIDDSDYPQAVELLDSAIEKLTQIRKYVEGNIK